MFESEAEEYTSNLLKDVNCTLGNPRARQINSIDVQDAWQKGAEFGYNKGKSEARELLKRCYDNYIYLEPLRSEIEQFLKEVEDE